MKTAPPHPMRLRNSVATADSQRRLSRRQFVRRAAGVAAGVTIGVSSTSALDQRRDKRLPTPQRSGIEHIILVMMENRSFDHFLGWLPGAEGRQSRLDVHRCRRNVSCHVSAGARLPKVADILTRIIPTKAAASSMITARATAGCARA